METEKIKKKTAGRRNRNIKISMFPKKTKRFQMKEKVLEGKINSLKSELSEIKSEFAKKRVNHNSPDIKGKMGGI